MSTHINLTYIYGFAAHHTDLGIRVPVPLGGKAPSLADWLEENGYDPGRYLHLAGVLETSFDKGAPDPYPFIGLKIRKTEDVIRKDSPFVQLPGWKVPEPEQELLGRIHRTLQCPHAICFYALLVIE